MMLTLLRQATLPVLLAWLLLGQGNVPLIWFCFVFSELMGIPVALLLWRHGSQVFQAQGESM